ncbi:related to ribosomal protein YmL25, mitochondrial [Rhynchosporium secalis]|uniref:Related to ribosomal protein YmL25, mitochondrial n=1 Tax=Rhynchosporium secalis TaxID=38038 RepID=A0A1E1M0S1_RHYSE|nr:related to ribosomal protein YmL25, mitochondrial [Rhynchosporium secalis]
MATHSRPLIRLAKSLPPKLLNFFQRYPPQAIVSSSPLSTSNTTSTDSTGSSADHTSTGQDGLVGPSPFRGQRSPITGKYHNPVYSLRRQADLLKLARKHGVEQLMPFSVKSTEERLRKREENGLRVKGTGIGQRVKGKESERTLKGRLEKRRKAMLEMPQMIQTWKERGHGRGWKKWPK